MPSHFFIITLNISKVFAGINSIHKMKQGSNLYTANIRVGLVLMSILWPFLSLFYAIRKFRYKAFHVVILLFVLTAAYTFIPQEGADSNAYLAYMDFYQDGSFSVFFSQFIKTIQGQGLNGYEFFIDFVSFISVWLSGGQALVFVLTGLTFYLAWIKIVSSLHNEYLLKNRVNTNAVIFLISFAVYIIFFRALNGRFYLAYWVFIWGAYNIIENKEYKYYFVTLLTIFIHQTFIIANALIILFFISSCFKGIRNYIFYALIIMGHLYSEFGREFVSQNLFFFGEAVENKLLGYTLVETLERASERAAITSWFLIIRQPLLFYGVLLVLLINRIRIKSTKHKNIENHYSFILLFYALVSFGYSIHHFGTRFRNILIGFIILLLFKIYNEFPVRKWSFEIWIFLFVFGFYLLVDLRMMSEQISAWLFMPIPILFHTLMPEETFWDFLPFT